jgi:hypothetical protein
MTPWLWITVGIGGFLVVSAALGLAVTAILAQISREISELLESEPELLDSELLASAPLARERASLEEAEREMPVEQYLAGLVTRKA